MNDVKRTKKRIFQLSEEGDALLIALTKDLGITQVSVIEIAVRKMAVAEGMKRQSDKKEGDE